MSLLDTASLIVTPNGVKEGKLYSVIPSDGSGDLSVVRATTATRVNSAGLVELVPYNLLTYSEALTPNYTFNQCSITSNQTDPNGTSNAKRITNGATATDVYFEQSIGITNSVYTWSVYVKKGTDTAATIKPVHVGIGGDVSLMTFTFATETIATSGAITTSGFTSLGNGWYRIYCSVPITSAVVSLRGRFGNTNTPNVYNDWFGAQLVEGSTAKDYQKTETRLNIPRLDYSNGTCPSLLVEPQRTNLLTYSSSFDNAAWTKSNASVTANTTTSPDGTQNADSLIENGANDHHLIYQGDNPVAGSYSASVFIKKNTRQYAFLQIATDTVVNRYTIVVDLNNGTMTASSTSGAPSGTSYKIDSIGNGWYRLSVTATHTAGLLYSIFGLSNSANPTFSAEAVPLYSGDGTSSAYFWGAQIESGSYSTSFIPTTSASVTRNADVISKTGISSLIGQTEGTFFTEFYYNGIIDNSNARKIISLNDGSSTNLIDAFIGVTGNTITTRVRANNSSLGQINSAVLTQGFYKIAYAYKNSDFVLYVNGVQAGSVSSGTISFTSAVSIAQIGDGEASNDQLGSLIKAAALWKTRLTNTQLAQLTTI